MNKPEYGNPGPTPHTQSPSYPGDSSLTSAPQSNTASAPFNNLSYPNTYGSLNNTISNANGSTSLPTPLTQQQQPSSSTSQIATQPSLPTNNILPDNAFFNLFWPNWPASLPSPKLVYSLCDIFFSKKWLCEGIVNKERFFKGLACPPHHAAFPHVSLLHAMCAVATKFVAPEGELPPPYSLISSMYCC